MSSTTEAGATRSFDPKKPMHCRNGNAARVICADRAGSAWPMMALVTLPHYPTEQLFNYSSEGRRAGVRDDPLDLVNIPEEKVTFKNVYIRNKMGDYGEEEFSLGKCVAGRKNSDGTIDPLWLCCIKITRTDGKITKVEVVAS